VLDVNFFDELRIVSPRLTTFVVGRTAR